MPQDDCITSILTIIYFLYLCKYISIFVNIIRIARHRFFAGYNYCCLRISFTPCPCFLNLVNISIQNTLNLYASISQVVHILAYLIISRIAIQISTFVISKNIIAPSPIIKEIL